MCCFATVSLWCCSVSWWDQSDAVNDAHAAMAQYQPGQAAGCRHSCIWAPHQRDKTDFKPLPSNEAFVGNGRENNAVIIQILRCDVTLAHCSSCFSDTSLLICSSNRVSAPWRIEKELFTQKHGKKLTFKKWRGWKRSLLAGTMTSLSNPFYEKILPWNSARKTKVAQVSLLHSYTLLAH